MYDDAVDAWVTDFAEGKATLLLAASNEEAATLARLARERLAERGLLVRADEITLSDSNAAGTGDLVQGPADTKIDAGGQTLSNRDTIKIEGVRGGGARVGDRSPPARPRPLVSVLRGARGLPGRRWLRLRGQRVGRRAARSTPVTW